VRETCPRFASVLWLGLGVELALEQAQRATRYATNAISPRLYCHITLKESIGFVLDPFSIIEVKQHMTRVVMYEQEELRISLDNVGLLSGLALATDYDGRITVTSHDIYSFISVKLL